MDFDSWKKIELVNFLRARKKRRTGNKAELIRLCRIYGDHPLSGNSSPQNVKSAFPSADQPSTSNDTQPLDCLSNLSWTEYNGQSKKTTKNLTVCSCYRFFILISRKHNSTQIWVGQDKILSKCHENANCFG